MKRTGGAFQSWGKIKGNHHQWLLKITDLFLLLSSALHSCAERGCSGGAFVVTFVPCVPQCLHIRHFPMADPLSADSTRLRGHLLGMMCAPCVFLLSCQSAPCRGGDASQRRVQDVAWQRTEPLMHQPRSRGRLDSFIGTTNKFGKMGVFSGIQTLPRVSHLLFLWLLFPCSVHLGLTCAISGRGPLAVWRPSSSIPFGQPFALQCILALCHSAVRDPLPPKTQEAKKTAQNVVSVFLTPFLPIVFKPVR